MSKTFTSRPGVRRVTQETTQHNMNTRPTRTTVARRPGIQGYDRRTGLTGTGSGVGEEAGLVDSKNENQSEQRILHQGAYTVIAPNEQKRKKVTQMAQQEMAAYEAHKQQTTPKSFTYVGTAGGGEMSIVDARRKLVQTSPNKTQKLLQQQERTSFLRQKEEAELQKKKDEQRQKAVLNARRKEEEKLAAESKWDDKRKRTNEAFLRRLENKTRQTTAESSCQPCPRPPNQSGGHNELLQALSLESKQDQTIQGAECSSGSSLTQEQRKKVDTLMTMFPQFRDVELIELLESLDYSLDSVVHILQD